MNRRQFAGWVAAASSAVSLRTFALPKASGGSPATLPLHLVYDTRVIERGRLGMRGAAVEHPFSGDVTRVWFDGLDALWRKQAIATLGITRPAEYFVLSTLARDQNYVVERADTVADRVTWLLVPRR